VVKEGKMLFELIAFDADDTLWHSETFYQEAQTGLAAILAPYGIHPDTLHDTLLHIEVGNLATLGYGAKAFTISMVEAGIQMTGGRISTADVQAIIGLGKAMLSHEIQLLEHSHGTVARLAQSHELMVITKGDLMDQERKLAASGLIEYFKKIEIVSDKKPQVYASLLQKHGVSPDHFLMIGNSMRSDILPVLDLGGWAVYVPYAMTWAHEQAMVEMVMKERFYEIDHLGQLPDLVAQLEEAKNIS
jgi:putative hydrolase of the HAD superfamily